MSDEKILPFSEDEIRVLTRASTDFVYFVNNIFSLSSRHFIKGEHIDNTARLLSQNKKTMRVSARNHFKSYSFYAHIMWKMMFELPQKNIEAQYFSFSQDLAGYHISKIKLAISANQYFRHIRDRKPTAESVIKYTWDDKTFYSLEPHGLIQFKRGIHADYVYVDDPFQDPENQLNPTIIKKINEIFKSNILDMPNEPDGELHCAGTPQTDEDFYFDKDITRRFTVKILPAITDEGKALWPEWMDIPELEQKRLERTDRIFKREYLCTPVYSTEGFFTREYLMKKVVNLDLVSYKARLKYSKQGEIIAGFDIGKKAHPSHLTVLEHRPNNKLVMIHQKWMDGWSYSNGKEFYDFAPTQLEYLKMVIQNFGIDRLYYDNTRGEFESFDEQGLLPRIMIPIVFNQKIKQIMSAAFDKVVERSQIEIINDDRLITQICSVTNSLEAIQSTKGHGDSYWSMCLALLGVKELSNYSEEGTQTNRKKITAGVKSIFSSDSAIPAGF